MRSPGTQVPALTIESDAHGRPKVERMRARIGDLEHRLDYLERKYDPSMDGSGRTRMLGEIYALRVAVVVMRWYDSQTDRESRLVGALQELIKAARGANESGGNTRLKEAVEDAEDVLVDVS